MVMNVAFCYGDDDLEAQEYTNVCLAALRFCVFNPVLVCNACLCPSFPEIWIFAEIPGAFVSKIYTYTRACVHEGVAQKFLVLSERKNTR